jgi:DNA modification methylase
MTTSTPNPGGDLQDTPIPLPRNTVLIGDIRSRLRELPAASVDCIITSPPYFAARDYGHDQQLGHEPDIESWVANLRDVCHELARVLKPTGALWLNLGDSYARRLTEGAGPKSMLLGPSRLALALLRDGWILRNHVVWAKTNPMPSSIQDRLTNTHETVYFFVRSPRYFFDLNAIRVPLVSQAAPNAEPHWKRPPSGSLPRERRINSNSGLTRLKSIGLAGHPLARTLATSGGWL